MNKYAGVVLDFHDDGGALLRDVFRTPQEVPQQLKTAVLRDPKALQDHDFALLMRDGDHAIRKYACTDAGTTGLQVMYFLRHHEKLPETAEKTAAARLVTFCRKFGLAPPVELSKMASTTPQDGYVVVTAAGPRTKMAAVERPKAEEDYGIAMAGTRKYPIHTPEFLKMGARYWGEHQHEMDPEVRRHFAVKLAAQARRQDVELTPDILKAGSLTYAGPQDMRRAIEQRKAVFDLHGEDERFLDGLLEKCGSVEPWVYAECLRRFDQQAGLDKGWGRYFPDPWGSTYGLQKTAESVWEDGSDYVTKEQLQNVAWNHSGALAELYTDDSFTKEFERDPVGVFRSLPTPFKRRLARLAADLSSRGGTEVLA